MIKKVSIYDLDGTVICSMHRYRTNKHGKIDLEYWRQNDTPEKIAKDSLLPLAERYKADLRNPEVFVIIATARACIENDANYKYIRDNLGMPNKFIHRKGNSDSRKGAELKYKGIRPILNLKNFSDVVIHVYEDNIDYLKELCDAFAKTHKTVGHYNPSKQGY